MRMHDSRDAPEQASGRREFLKTVTFGALAVPSLSAVIENGGPTAHAEDGRGVTARARFEHHLAEMKKAAEELDPCIGAWHVALADDGDAGCGLAISAYRVSGRYQGDGTYEASRERALGGRTQYEVRLLDEHSGGDRVFLVSNSMDRMKLPEPRFNTFIGRKIT